MSLRSRTSRIPQLLFAVSLLGVLVAPPAVATTARPPSGGDLPLRVATYNIHAGAGWTASSTWTARQPNSVLWTPM